MTKQIKPPKGYRILKQGEMTKRGDKWLCPDSGWSKLPKDFYHERFHHSWHPFARKIARKLTKRPTAEMCWRWLYKHKASVEPVRDFWMCKWEEPTGMLHAVNGPNPIAAVRAAMESEKG